MRATAVSFSAFCASLAFYHATRTQRRFMPSMLSRRWHIFPPKKPVFEGWAACASGEWSSYQFRRDLDAPPSLPPSLVRKSHRRACFGVLPKRVSAGRERSFSRRARAPRAMPRGRRPKNRQQIAPSFAVPHVRRPRSRGRRERRGAADPGDERARNRPDPLSLGSALRGAALALLLCRERFAS